MSLSARGLIRFDVEDYLTPESDDALLHMLGSMHKSGIPGSYGVVGKKANALAEHGRKDVLTALAGEEALGFHSWSHSEHPTLAEDLASLDYEEGMARFIEREGPGVEAVARQVKPPRYFTQPGGNWVPEALEALPRVGIGTYFTDSFNSYVVDLPGPYWLGEVLLFSFPVVNPRPFGLGLPGNLNQALALVEERQDAAGDFMVMVHPTELVTREFWDAVNFFKGRTRNPVIPAPLRAKQEQIEAMRSFEKYLQEISHFDLEWCDSETLRGKVEPRRSILAARSEILAAVQGQGWGPMALQDGFLSAAEALYGLAKSINLPASAQIPIGYVGAPRRWEASEKLWPPYGSDQLFRAAEWVVRSVEREGRLPTDEPERGLTLQRTMRSLTGPRADVPLAFLAYIKAPELLHWDWPIFPEEFRPWRLWKDARRLAWTLKPAAERGMRHNDMWEGR